jgi:hypothetical protein
MKATCWTAVFYPQRHGAETGLSDRRCTSSLSVAVLTGAFVPRFRRLAHTTPRLGDSIPHMPAAAPAW